MIELSVISYLLSSQYFIYVLEMVLKQYMYSPRKKYVMAFLCSNISSFRIRMI